MSTKSKASIKLDPLQKDEPKLTEIEKKKLELKKKEKQLMNLPNRTIPKLPFSERSPHRFIKKKYIAGDKVVE